MEIGEVSSGYDFEKKVLGVSSKDVSQKVTHLFRRRTKFKKAVEIVKDIQNVLEWDPKNPSTEIARMIYKTICSGLSKHSGKLCFYSALGTTLDYRYGTDCFFSLQIGDRESIVTVDLAIRRKKDPKADIVISIDDVRGDKFYQIARKITEKLLARMHSKCNKEKSKKYGNKYVLRANP